MDKNIHPSATEVCNYKDDNCNGQTDENCDKIWIAETKKKKVNAAHNFASVRMMVGEDCRRRRHH